MQVFRKSSELKSNSLQKVKLSTFFNYARDLFFLLL